MEGGKIGDHWRYWGPLVVDAVGYRFGEDYIKSGLLDCRDPLHDPQSYVFDMGSSRKYQATWSNKNKSTKYLTNSQPIHIDPQYLTPNPDAPPYDGPPLVLHNPEIFDGSTLAILGALGIS